MARLDQDFTGDLSTLEYTPKKIIAPGKYKALIVGCDYKANKHNNGFNLIPTFQIIEGEYKGEEITQWLCVKHPESKTQEIAIGKKARLGVILCGTPNPADTNLLLNKPLIIETTTEPNSYTNKEGILVESVNNVIRQYHPVNGEFKDLVTGRKSGSVPPIAHSTITNGAGGSFNTSSLNDEIPF